ncbi:MAG: ABC transporter ATP-binding protein [Bacilli bacterium]
MLKLKNVSKFYYNKGIVTSGFSKVNLEFTIGEFIVITGESGSGKSTLLNVISGLDTYEEGEMYINDEETSHYTETDFEDYRKKYIGNIFQNFNLVNSYTVYQNIELILLINGYKGHVVKEKVLDIIKKVNLQKYKNTKVSKLSGGQKQRVAIARALAKETSIIVADEPTGNLDSKAAEGIVKLLHEISKDKLVVVVTHNYDQFSNYATRKIKMHDGKVSEDKKIKEVDVSTTLQENNYKKITLFNKIRLGVRNTFNIIPKFALLLAVFLFIVFAISSEYTILKKQDNEVNKQGYNQFFNNYSENRIVIKKKDNSQFNNEDYENIKSLSNVKTLIKDDALLDSYVNLDKDNFYFWGHSQSISTFEGKVDKGRMPKSDDEIIVQGRKNDYYLSKNLNKLFDVEYNISINNNNLNSMVKIVGIKYFDKGDPSENKVYVSESVLDGFRKITYQNFSLIESTLNGKSFKSEQYSSINRIVPNDKVGRGEALVSEDLNTICNKSNCKNSVINISASNLYYTDNINLKITNMYNKSTHKRLTGLQNYDFHVGEIYINSADYDTLFVKGNYQSSVFVKDVKEINDTVNKLNDNYQTLVLKDALAKSDGSTQIMSIFRVVLITILTFVLFFISYFIIKLILKSRNVYFSTLRILGSSKKDSKSILDVELFSVINIAYGIFIGLILLVNNNVISSSYIKDLLTYLNITDYVLIYVILIAMSYLISNRFSRSVFKKSAMNTYREEV